MFSRGSIFSLVKLKEFKKSGLDKYAYSDNFLLIIQHYS